MQNLDVEAPSMELKTWDLDRYVHMYYVLRTAAWKKLERQAVGS